MALGLTSAKISRVERGETQPDNEMLKAMRAKFNVSADWILTGEDALEPVMLPADHRPIRQSLAELVDAVQSGRLARVADEEETYLGKITGARIPVFEIEGGHEIPYEGDRPARISEVFTNAPVGLDDRDAFACRLADDSMEPGFNEGDVLYFSPGAEMRDGDYACVRIDEKSTFRQVFIQDDIVRLAAINRKYPEVRLARDQVKSMFRLVWRMTRY